MSDTNKRIIFTNAEGGVSVVIPAPGTWLTIKEVAEKSVPRGVEYSIVDVSEVSSDREFRNAWKSTDGKKIEVDLDKAKNVVKERIRAERAPELEKLDLEVLRADETGDTTKKAEIVAKKQALRDATDSPAIVNATTVEELKGLNLSALLARAKL